MSDESKIGHTPVPQPAAPERPMTEGSNYPVNGSNYFVGAPTPVDPRSGAPVREGAAASWEVIAQLVKLQHELADLRKERDALRGQWIACSGCGRSGPFNYVGKVFTPDKPKT